MIYQLKCPECGAVCWVRGTEDYDTNALELDEDSEWEWEGTMTECEHMDADVVDCESEPYFPDDV